MSFYMFSSIIRNDKKAKPPVRVGRKDMGLGRNDAGLLTVDIIEFLDGRIATVDARPGILLG